MTEEQERILNSGELYDSNELSTDQMDYIERVNEYNRSVSSKDAFKKRQERLNKRLKKAGKNIYIEPPFHANWGGKHVSIGDNFYANFNLLLVDDGDILIGDNVRFGPNVSIVTATHPICPELRKYKIEYNKPVVIGNNVWIGANTTVLPGVTIGDNSVIGAGSLVAKDIPANVVARGSPCKVYREITKEDNQTYDHGKKIEKSWHEKYGF